MSIASRKEREFQAREKLIIETSFSMLVELGYIGFTIDKLAKKIDYAKGTIYKHFTCKEDIIIRILNDSFIKRHEVIERTFDLDLPARARFLVSSIAVHLFHEINPDLHKLIHISHVGSIWNKAGDKLKEEHNKLMSKSYNHLDKLIAEAQENGNLVLGEHTVVDIFYSLITTIISYAKLLNDCGASDAPPMFQKCFGSLGESFDLRKMLKMTLNTYLDGLNWHPLSTECNYDELLEKTIIELYPDLVEERKRLKLKK